VSVELIASVLSDSEGAVSSHSGRYDVSSSIELLDCNESRPQLSHLLEGSTPKVSTGVLTSPKSTAFFGDNFPLLAALKVELNLEVERLLATVLRKIDIFSIKQFLVIEAGL